MHTRIAVTLFAFTVIFLTGCSSQTTLTSGNGSLTPSLRSQPASGGYPHARPHWTENVLYSFGNSPDGWAPRAGLINVAGTLYGTTEYGGGDVCAGSGCGTVFSITTSGAYSSLYSFAGSPSDGANPTAVLTNINHVLFGTTYYGGANKTRCKVAGQGGGCGTFFKITIAGAETVRYSFAGSKTDGSHPFAGPTNVNGTLYGTTESGDGRCSGVVRGCGIVYMMTKKGREYVLHRFTGGADGAYPIAGLTNLNGSLYGTTYYGGINANCPSGCGTVFRITPSGTYSQVYRFAGNTGSLTDGANPQGSLTNVDGTLYGTTTLGGAAGTGTVFTITIAGAERVIYSFCRLPSCNDGAQPNGDLILIGKTLYGTTDTGGANYSGIVYSITTKGDENTLHIFTGYSDGGNPQGGSDSQYWRQ